MVQKKNFNIFLSKLLIFNMLNKLSLKNINIEFIQLTFDGLNKFQKSLSSIIASVETLSNHYI